MSEFDNENVEVVYGQETTGPIQPQKKGFGIASLVLGITSIVPGCCCSYIGIVLGILAVVFAILFLNANKGQLVGKGMAMAGLILGIVGVLVCTVLLIIGIANVASGDYENFVQDFVNSIEDSVEE
ncbi:MAG: DUF4190 domain-containing protein [Vallitaleaceae bacterium]|nr:DUF4190 domain-containing protein [Vallitaleaceae bacterium]